VGRRAVLDAVVKKIPSPNRESNPRTPNFQYPLSEIYFHYQHQSLLCSFFFNYVHVMNSLNISVGVALGYWLWVLRFDFRRGLGISVITTASRMALGPTQPPI
jgi:hypothetical protein